jgi:hypothetical protein
MTPSSSGVSRSASWVAGEFPGTLEDFAQEVVHIDTAELGVDERGYRFTQLTVEVGEHVAQDDEGAARCKSTRRFAAGGDRCPCFQYR